MDANRFKYHLFREKRTERIYEKLGWIYYRNFVDGNSAVLRWSSEPRSDFDHAYGNPASKREPGYRFRAEPGDGF